MARAVPRLAGDLDVVLRLRCRRWRDIGGNNRDLVVGQGCGRGRGNWRVRGGSVKAAEQGQGKKGKDYFHGRRWWTKPDELKSPDSGRFH